MGHNAAGLGREGGDAQSPLGRAGGSQRSRLRAGRRGRAESARPRRWVTTQQAEGRKEGTRRVRSAAQVGHNAAGGGQEGGDAQSPLGRAGGSRSIDRAKH